MSFLATSFAPPPSPQPSLWPFLALPTVRCFEQPRFLLMSGGVADVPTRPGQSRICPLRALPTLPARPAPRQRFATTSMTAQRQSGRRHITRRAFSGLLAAVFASGWGVPPKAIAAEDGAEAPAVWSTLAMIDRGQFAGADPRLTQLIGEGVAENAGAQQLTILYKYRANVRARLGRLEDAFEDFTRAVEARDTVDVLMESDTLCVGPEYCVPVPSASDLLLQRSRLGMLLGVESTLKLAASDLSRIIEEDDAIQPYAHLWRGDTLMRLADYRGAATDFAAATQQFASIKDEASTELARAGWAFALYGQAGKEDEGEAMMQDVVLRAAGVNGEIELLVPLAERQASVHVALAALAWSRGKTAEAESEWDSACVRMDATNEFVAGGQRDPRKELAFRQSFFPGSQSLRTNTQLLYLQATKPYDPNIPRIGAGSPRVQREGGGGGRGGRVFRERGWVETVIGWPPSLLDKLDFFFGVTAQNQKV